MKDPKLMTDEELQQAYDELYAIVQTPECSDTDRQDFMLVDMEVLYRNLQRKPSPPIPPTPPEEDE